MQTARQRIDSTNQQRHNAWCNTSVDLNWEWAKHRTKQLSSGKQITLVAGYWKIKIWRRVKQYCFHIKNSEYMILWHCRGLCRRVMGGSVAWTVTWHRKWHQTTYGWDLWNSSSCSTVSILDNEGSGMVTVTSTWFIPSSLKSPFSVLCAWSRHHFNKNDRDFNHDKKYFNKKERERPLPGAVFLCSWWRPQCRLKATHFIHFHRDLRIPAMSTDGSQVGVTLFTSC